MRVWIETMKQTTKQTIVGVTLRVRVWIETALLIAASADVVVTLRVRVWIETQTGWKKARKT